MGWGPNCFWYWLSENYPPNILWCEERMCSFVVTPFNTWTNLAYILASIYVWKQVRNHQNALFRFYSQALFWVGLSSLIYHASINFFTQIFDFFGMYLFCFLLIMYNRERVGKWPSGRAGLNRFWMWVTGLTLFTTGSLMIHPKFPIQAYVLMLIITIIASEFKAPAPASSPKRTYFWFAVASLFVAAVFSALDAARVLCDPTNHWFQGHGIWHVLGTVALLFAFQHYRRVYDRP